MEENQESLVVSFLPQSSEEIVSHNMEFQPIVSRSKRISDTRDTCSKQLSISSMEQLKL